MAWQPIAEERRYFWTAWLEAASPRTLAAAYVLLSVADLLCTMNAVGPDATPLGVREGNPLARVVLSLLGPQGMVVYKAALVLLILGLVYLIQRRQPHTAHLVLWGAVLVMAVVALRHLAIFAAASALLQYL